MVSKGLNFVGAENIENVNSNASSGGERILLVCMSDVEYRVVRDVYPDGAVCYVENVRDGKRSDWSKYTVGGEVDGIDYWDEINEEELGGIECRVVLDKKTAGVLGGKGRKAWKDVVDFLGGIFGSSVGIEVPKGEVFKNFVREEEGHEFLFGAEKDEAIMLGAEEVDRLREIVEKCGEVGSRNENLFLRGGDLVYAYKGKARSISGNGLKGWCASNGVKFWTPNEDETKYKRELKRDDANVVCDSPELWDGHVPELKGIVGAPVIGKGLVPRFSEGYDPDTGMLVIDGFSGLDDMRYEDPESRFEREEGAEAAKRLMEWFDGFAFVHSGSKADALAFVLTPLLMDILDVQIPGLLVTANKPGTGKTTAAEIIGKMSGSVASKLAWPNMDKANDTITAILEGSSKFVIFDNIKSKLESAEVEKLLTSRDWETRAFRTQANLKYENRKVWSFTQNGSTASEDMLRRVVIIPMDRSAITEEEQAKWDNNRLEKIGESRESILLDIVTMILAWRDAGCPKGNAEYDGYSIWAETISGIFDVCSVEGFLTSREVTKEEVDTGTDYHAINLSRVLRVMYAHDEWTISDLQDRLNIDYLDEVSLDPQDKLDITALRKLFSGKGDPARIIGNRLSYLIEDGLLPYAKLNKRKTREGVKYNVVFPNGKPPYKELVQNNKRE